MKFVTIDQGRPDLSKIPKDCPGEVNIYELIFLRVFFRFDFFTKIIEIMKKCWNNDPNFRPSMTEVIATLNCL